MLAQMQS